jgi:hypothetical protein
MENVPADYFYSNDIKIVCIGLSAGKKMQFGYGCIHLQNNGVRIADVGQGSS